MLELGNAIWTSTPPLRAKNVAIPRPSAPVPHLRKAQVALLAAVKCFEEHDETTGLKYIATLSGHVAQAMGVARIP